MDLVLDAIDRRIAKPEKGWKRSTYGGGKVALRIIAPAAIGFFGAGLLGEDGADIAIDIAVTQATRIGTEAVMNKIFSESDED